MRKIALAMCFAMAATAAVAEEKKWHEPRGLESLDEMAAARHDIEEAKKGPVNQPTTEGRSVTPVDLGPRIPTIIKPASDSARKAHTGAR